MKDDKRNSGASWIVAALLLVPVIYVGSYLALVRPKSVLVLYPRDASDAIPGEPLYIRTHYPDGVEFSPAIFWPLEQLDRRVRPGSWVGGPVAHPAPYQHFLEDSLNP